MTQGPKTRPAPDPGASVWERLGQALGRSSNETPLSVQMSTPRCTLRAALPKDASALYEATCSPGFLTWMSWEPPKDERALANRFRRLRKAWLRGEGYCFSVLSDVAPKHAAEVDPTARAGRGQKSAPVIGGVDLKCDVRAVTPATLNLGYWIHPRWQGLGLASEAVGTVVQWAFATLEIDRLVAAVGVENLSSQRVIAKLGFEPFERSQTCGLKRFENVRYQLLRS